MQHQFLVKCETTIESYNTMHSLTHKYTDTELFHFSDILGRLNKEERNIGNHKTAQKVAQKSHTLLSDHFYIMSLPLSTYYLIILHH